MFAKFLKKDETNRFDLLTAGSGLLAGCVSITAGCAVVSLLSAACIGVLGCCCYLTGKVVWFRYQIDDPLQASQIHGLCGFWGVIAAGLFHKENGLLFTGDIRQVGIQILGALALAGYSGLVSSLFFSILRHMNRFRIGDTIEIAGMDMLDDAIKLDTKI